MDISPFLAKVGQKASISYIKAITLWYLFYFFYPQMSIHRGGG